MARLTQSLSRRLTMPVAMPMPIAPTSGGGVPGLRYIAPTEQGTGAGDSWENAAGISSAALDAAIEAVGSGGTVYLASHLGNYTDGLYDITKGGSASSRVTVQGANADLVPTNIPIVGSRDAWTLPVDPEEVTDVRSWNTGSIFFRLNTGADYLTFSHFNPTRIGDGLISCLTAVHDITLRNVEAYNIRRLFDQASGIDLYNILVEQFEVVGHSKHCIRFRGNSHDFVIQDGTLNSGRQHGDNFASGIILDETAHDATIARVIARNNHDQTSGAYWNSDGFQDEEGCYNITYEDCESYGNTDAGYDLKSINAVMTRCIAEDNKKNFKLWGSGVANDCEITNANLRGGSSSPLNIEMIGRNDSGVVPANWTFNDPIIRESSTATIAFGNFDAPVLTLNDYDIVKNLDAVLNETGGGFDPMVFTVNPALPTVSFTIDWRAGFTDGVVPEATSPGTVLADLNVVTGSGTFSELTDTDGKFTVSGTTLLLGASVSAASAGSHSVTVRLIHPTGLASADETETISVLSANPERDAILAALTVDPDGTRIGHIDTLIASLKTGAVSGSDIWAKLDQLIIPAADTSQFAYLNWKTPGTWGATANGTGTLTTDRGYAGDGTTGYLSTAYYPGISGSQAGQDNHFMGVWSRTDAAGAMIDYGNSKDSINGRNASNQLSTRNKTTTTDNVANASSAGWCAASRTASGSYERYKDTTTLASQTRTSTAPSAFGFAIGARNSAGTIDSFSTREIFAVVSAVGLTANENTDLYNALDVYRTALGA